MRYVLYKKDFQLNPAREEITLTEEGELSLRFAKSLDCDETLSVEVFPTVWLTFSASEWADVALSHNPPPVSKGNPTITVSKE